MKRSLCKNDSERKPEYRYYIHNNYCEHACTMYVYRTLVIEVHSITNDYTIISIYYYNIWSVFTMSC